MVTVQQEKLRDCLDEMKPLFALHWEEVAAYKDVVKLDPNYEFYLRADSIDAIKAYTLRDASGTLVGYSVYFFHLNPHYQTRVWALNDVLYVRPAFRRHAVRLIRYAETELTKAGASVITYHGKDLHSIDRIMNHTGYDKLESLYSKFVGYQ